MLLPILEVSPSFGPVWEEFLAEWKDEDELPLYLLLGDLARHIGSLQKHGSESELEKIFAVIETWHTDGDDYVREAATVGMLEDLQNSGLVGVEPDAFEAYLGPESKRWWEKVQRFWEHGELIKDD
jgi:hypothetical protein